MVKRLIFISLFILILTLSRGTFSQTIYMREVAFVKDEMMRLGDLINIKNIPENIRNKFEEYTFSFSTQSLHLIPSRIIRKVVEAYNPGNTNVVIGNRIAVIPAKIITGCPADFYVRFLEFLNQMDLDKESRVEIEMLETPLFKDEAVYNSFSFSITQKMKYRGYLVGDMDVICEATREREPEEKLLIPFSVYLHRFVPVFKARVDLGRGDKLSQNNVIISEEYLKSFGREILLGHEDPEQYIVTLPIERNSAILKSNLSKEMMVKAGENVQVILKRQNIYLTIPGKVATSASMGDMVNVKLLYSSKYMSARVIGYKEVEVEI